LYKETQICLPCDGMGYIKKIDTEYTDVGNDESSPACSDIFNADSYPVISLDECAALKNECIICNTYEPTTQPTSSRA